MSPGALSHPKFTIIIIWKVKHEVDSSLSRSSSMYIEIALAGARRGSIYCNRVANANVSLNLPRPHSAVGTEIDVFFHGQGVKEDALKSPQAVNPSAVCDRGTRTPSPFAVPYPASAPPPEMQSPSLLLRSSVPSAGPSRCRVS